MKYVCGIFLALSSALALAQDDIDDPLADVCDLGGPGSPEHLDPTQIELEELFVIVRQDSVVTCEEVEALMDGVKSTRRSSVNGGRAFQYCMPKYMQEVKRLYELNAQQSEACDFDLSF